MNQKITELQVRGLCRELVREGAPVSGRRLRRELLSRYGAVGKTARVFRIWRQETRRVAPTMPADAAKPRVPTERSELQNRMIQAESEARAYRERAELAEFRERAHQDRWAMEIDRLREELRAQPRYVQEIRRLEAEVLRLHAQLARGVA
jgi:hypothetical protein